MRNSKKLAYFVSVLLRSKIILSHTLQKTSNLSHDLRILGHSPKWKIIFLNSCYILIKRLSITNEHKREPFQTYFQINQLFGKLTSNPKPTVHIGPYLKKTTYLFFCIQGKNCLRDRVSYHFIFLNSYRSFKITDFR